MKLPALLFSFMIICVQATHAGVVILPRKTTLTGPAARQRVLVEIEREDEYSGQISQPVLVSSDPNVVRIDGEHLLPVGNGTAEISVSTRAGDAVASVTVVGMDREHAWSFRNHVQAILARAGCNSGACHGALAGKGGFKLSLRGYDIKSDYHAITRQARGRRIELSDPGRSLLLAKPSGGIPHKGGLRFAVDSRNYQVLAEWIAAGAEPPTEKDAQLARLEILPGRTSLKKNARQQLIVRAFYSDGRVEDVTDWAKFTSSNEAVATVDENGLVNVVGCGEGAVTAWFASRIVIARITVPYENTVAPEVFASAPRVNFIDELVLTQLQRLNLPPSPPATDAEFFRRAYLDTIGTLPTAAEVRAFAVDESENKRDTLIDALLERPEFVDYWTYKWSDVLMINGTLLRPKAVESYYKWVRERVAANMPWDQFVRELVTAQGDSYENGATNFYALHQQPEQMAENVSQAFLGLSIACAKCHNHPLEKWTNDQYYAFANLFARVRAKGWGGDARNGDGKRTLYVSTSGDLIQPLTGKPQPPTPLDGTALAFDNPSDRRIHLARWLTSADNPYFARSVTNRVWANFFGVGLVEDIDDMRASNPASNEELLSSSARYLAEHDFDLKQLMRAILKSATYQRSSQVLPENANEKRFYSRYYPRRLMAEVLLDAISQATDVPTSFTKIGFPGADIRKTDFYKGKTRAIQLYDSAVVSYFLKTFGRNQRRITCECERSDEPSMVQVLHLSNGDTINKKLATKDCRVDQVLKPDVSTEQLIEEAFLVTLSRLPTANEKQRLGKILDDTPAAEKRVVVEDMFWGIMSSREFIFNH